MVGLLQTQSGEIRDLIIIHPPHDHHVDLDGVEANPLGYTQAFPNSLEHVSPRDLGVAVWLKRIKAHVDPADTGSQEVSGNFRQENTIRGQGDLLQPRNLSERSHKVNYPSSNERLSPRKPDFPDTPAHRKPGHPENFLVCEDFLMRQPGKALLGHAVDTAKIAAIGQ